MVRVMVAIGTGKNYDPKLHTLSISTR